MAIIDDKYGEKTQRGDYYEAGKEIIDNHRLNSLKASIAAAKGTKNEILVSKIFIDLTFSNIVCGPFQTRVKKTSLDQFKYWCDAQGLLHHDNPQSIFIVLKHKD